MEPQSLGMPDQPFYRTLHQLRDLIASGRTAPLNSLLLLWLGRSW